MHYIKIAILIVIIVIIFFLYKYLTNESFTETKYDIIKKYIVPVATRDKILAGYKKIHEIFNKNNIFYIIEGGTLLGAVRNNKLIPWDDDGDIFVWKKDQKKIMSLVNEFAKHGYLLSETIHPRVLRITLDKKTNYPFIDLFLYDEPDLNANDNKVVRCLPFANNMTNVTCNKNDCCYPDRTVTWWWQNAYKVEDIHPRKIYKLNDIEVWGPNNPIPYIEGWYGEAALNTFKFTHSHGDDWKEKTEYTFSPKEVEDIYNLYNN